ncbi:hypothetical protein [Streptomyces albidoflavus]|uniref:hypothetical protein n=1 Tax=Streptomyces albidoflavus TaxID=1886 RepID=UPI00340ABC70
MDYSSLYWDEATRDLDGERAELARTAALSDAETMLGSLVFQARSAEDLGHRLALAEPHLEAIAQRRGYPAAELAEDLTRRWQLLHTARAAKEAEDAARTAEERTVTAAQEQRMDAAVAQLAAHAARANPEVPMAECLRLATEAVRKHADAYPLAYESWGGAADGPFTDRAKHWKPPGAKAPAQPDSPAAAAVPGSPETPDAPDHDAPFRAAKGDLEPRWDALTGRASLHADAAWDWSKPFRTLRDRFTNAPSDGHASTTTPAPEPAPESDLLHGFDTARAEMQRKWDANAAAPGASKEHLDEHDPTHDPSNYTKGLMDVFDHAKAEIGNGTPHHQAPAGVPGGFSHAETGAGGGQQHLPTDPTPSFSHAPTPDVAGGRNESTNPIPSYFQHGVR